MHEITVDQQAALPGSRSDFTQPMIKVLIGNGQGVEVLQLLHSVGLTYQETTRKPGFKLLSKGR